jgi:membrane-associated phospholipid phosphatase
MRKLCVVVAVFAAVLGAPAVARADIVTSWNRTMIDVLEASHTPPPPGARDAAIVESAVFDAVNGIARRYTPVHVEPLGPHGASQAAAAAAAAHEALVALFPTQQPLLEQRYADSLAELGSTPPVRRGLAWGTQVADEILAWRAGDGFSIVPPTYTPVPLPGRWQPTPPSMGPPLFRQFAQLTPFALVSPSQFPVPGPPPLASASYARDYQEVLELGSADSIMRTAAQTETAKFWQLDIPAAMWGRVADDLLEARPVSLVRSARIMALMNIALTDTTIAVWNAKNLFDTWRPITAIADGSADGNPLTGPVPGWTPLLPTPQFQEYPSAHSAVSAAATSVLAAFFGDRTDFTVQSAGLPGVERNFASFSAAVTQVADARIYAGFHFRFSCEDGIALGSEIAAYVRSTHLVRALGEDDD